MKRSSCTTERETDVPRTHVESLSLLIAQMRDGRRGPRPKLGPYVLATVVLAHLHAGVVLTYLARAYDVGKSRLYHRVTEVVTMLSSMAPELVSVTGEGLAHLVLDGTLVRTGRVRKRRSDGRHVYYSGKHKAFGVALQGLMGPGGELLWLSPGLPGSTHDITAARHYRVLEHLSTLEVLTLADSGYQGAGRESGGQVVTPYRGRGLTAPYEEARREHAAIRCLGERGFAVLKAWKVMRRFTRDPGLVNVYARAVLVLEGWREQSTPERLSGGTENSMVELYPHN